VQLSCHTLPAGRYDHGEWLADGPVLAPEVRCRGMAISEGRTATTELTRLLFEGGLDPQE